MKELNLAKKEKVMKKYYDDLFTEDISFREKWEGKIGIEYRVPKEVGYLINFLKDKNPRSISILEIGAGDGVSASMIIKELRPKQYVAVELSTKGVKKLKMKGIKAMQMDATCLNFRDNSFDIVCCFNTMHHVNNPRKMAQEMLRVTRKYFLLCEANGLSLPRKVLELTSRNRQANENSYLPLKYKSFFDSKRLKWIKIKPFCFAFAFTPDFLYDSAVFLSELFEKITIFRWQGSSLLIIGEKVV